MNIVKKLLFMVLVTFVLVGCASTKITDPSDPSFDLAAFRFEDYRDDRDLLPVLEKLFPVGTHKQVIEKTLINDAGASLVKVPWREYEYVYMHVRGSFLMKCAMKVRAVYDGQHTLAEKLKVFYGCK